MNNDNNDSQNTSQGWHPTQLAYVAPDPADEETPLGAAPAQPIPPTPSTIPVAPVQPAAPAPIAQPAPQPVQPIQPAPAPPPVQQPPTPVQPIAPAPPPVSTAQPAPIPVQPPVPAAPPVPEHVPQPAAQVGPPPSTPEPVALKKPEPAPSIFSTSPHEQPKSTEKKKLRVPSPSKRTAATLGTIAFILGVAGAGAYGFYYYGKPAKPSPAKVMVAATPSKTPQNQKVLGIVDSVRKKVSDLPAGETPTIATVTNLNKLKGQAFFDKAQLGDKVLIYAGAKKAYLYRPSTNAIIQESEVEVDGDKVASATASAETTDSSGKPVLKIKF